MKKKEFTEILTILQEQDKEFDKSPISCYNKYKK